MIEVTLVLVKLRLSILQLPRRDVCDLSLSKLDFKLYFSFDGFYIGFGS